MPFDGYSYNRDNGQGDEITLLVKSTRCFGDNRNWLTAQVVETLNCTSEEAEIRTSTTGIEYKHKSPYPVFSWLVMIPKAHLTDFRQNVLAQEPFSSVELYEEIETPSPNRDKPHSPGLE